MNFGKKLLTKIGGLTVASLTRHWMGTLDYSVVYYDPTVDPARPGKPGKRGSSP